MIRGAVLALCLFGPILPAAAQTTPQPLVPQTRAAQSDWPCVQRKVAKLSPGAFWTGPEISEELPWRDDEAVAQLVPALVSRRVSMEDAGKLVEGFAKAHAADKRQKLTLLFAGVYNEINNLRSDVIRGIGRFAKNQQAKSAQLIKARDDLEALEAKQDKTEGDLTRLGELQTQVQWLQRIYDDRESTTRYICEVPTILEQRLFAVAKLIEDQMPPTQ